MSNESSPVELAYRKRIDAMSAVERVARSAAMFQWTREQIARRIVAQQGPVEKETLKWLVTLRLYGEQPMMRQLIERKLVDVSR